MTQKIGTLEKEKTEDQNMILNLEKKNFPIRSRSCK